MIELSIVIVNYNTPQYTAQCLDSLLAQPPETPHEIIVVDNASTDNSVQALAARYPQIHMVRSPSNGGIAGGNNLGIKASAGRYILLLNNDTLVVPRTIDRCIRFLETRPEVAGVGGKLLNPDSTFQGSFNDFPSLWQVFLIVTKLGFLVNPYLPSYPPLDEVHEADWISTAFMAFRADALYQVGLVDERYFIYSDETDLQYRLARAGWKIVYLPDVTTIHFGGKSTNPWRRRRLVYRGYLLFFHKHYGTLRAIGLRLLFVSVTLPKLVFWGARSVFPRWRMNARQELESNWSILRMSLRPGVENP